MGGKTVKVRIMPFLAIVLTFAAGCGTTTKNPAPEYLSDIPEYLAPSETFDTSARICTYNTLWVANPIVSALSSAGYSVVKPEDFEKDELLPADYIIEPLSFRHFTQKYHGNIWLFTHLAVLVRCPARIDGETSNVEYRRPPRIFQAFARRNIGPAKGNKGVSLQGEYRKNMDEAVKNLFCIDEFRRALEK